ncbi:MHS family citrate/tricarballylate:H+ symporter-like MFS transporter [Bosea sp. BE125]|uniref:MFS transporter n=1 Tax=Bosea sp. BE125 TaxID=2817909 RepID=UPI00285CB7EB|nr:MFS transporter [Bosea sp. BE125]MDR6871323.1 MHS family citrate/tricarballylate:H+ symporter-like MFS transporter [Bosea sp. BE125]
MTASSDRQSKIGAVIRVSSGNFLEMYDFFVFGYYASAIGKAFFPSGSEFAQLMAALMTFGAGFLMRPLGAIVLGTYIDHHGRRAGLLLTLGLMAFGTLTIALVPTYATIGLLAPVIVVIGRLVQGFSAGVELGGVSVYLSEIATPGNKGFYVSWQSGSQQIAVIFVALLGVWLSTILPPEDMTAWGWRIPFLVGCLIVPLIFLLRRSMQETEEFEERRKSASHPSPREILRSLVQNWQSVIIGMLLVTMTTVSFYFITAYTPTFGREVLKLTGLDALLVTVCVGLSNLFWLPVMGALSDRIGRKPLLFAFTLLMFVSAYPALSWLVSAPSFVRLLEVELWLSFIYGSYNGAMVVALTEIIPVQLRTTGFSVAYSLATALFGGFTPAVSTYLIEVTGNRAVAGLWLMFAAACGFLATWLAYRSRPQVTAGAVSRAGLSPGG